MHLNYKALFNNLYSLTNNEFIDFFKPLFWPKQSVKLRLLVIASFLCVGVELIVNVYVPIYTQKIVNILSEKDGKGSSLFPILTIFLVLKLLQGVGTLSLLNVVQSLLWIKLEQNAHKTIQVQFFSHLHKMSSQWQLSQKSADVLGFLERGTAATTSILERFIYSIFPTIANILIAIIYLSLKFNGTIGLLVLLQTVCYVWTTLKFTEWRSRYQKCLNKSEDEKKQQAMESLLNFETVKLFVNENHEANKYSKAIDQFHEHEFSVLVSLNFLQFLQLAIVNLGLFISSLVVISLIVDDKALVVGDYVLFTAYMGQLILPLNWLGAHYRTIRIGLTNLDYMMQILRQRPDSDHQNKEVNITEGQIEFKNVHFSHTENKPVLQGLSFTVSPKKTIALVGASGAGKSTIVKLLTKLYEPISGEILIDGQSLKDCNTSSVRKSIGVVPQDTVLFHDTILNNIKYAKLDATNYEVVLAAQSAQIHDTIMMLPDKYDTMVGERGLKLSGGEKQRISICRIFLKNSPIVLLDEATSSLDVKTEADIMTSFAKLCKNRTSIIVTHRLQNVVNVDNICVLKNGVIVECGTHSQLLKMQGEYYLLWHQQIGDV